MLKLVIILSAVKGNKMPVYTAYRTSFSHLALGVKFVSFSVSLGFFSQLHVYIQIMLYIICPSSLCCCFDKWRIEKNIVSLPLSVSVAVNSIVSLTLIFIYKIVFVFAWFLCVCFSSLVCLAWLFMPVLVACEPD